MGESVEKTRRFYTAKQLLEAKGWLIIEPILFLFALLIQLFEKPLHNWNRLSWGLVGLIGFYIYATFRNWEAGRGAQTPLVKLYQWMKHRLKHT